LIRLNFVPAGKYSAFGQGVVRNSTADRGATRVAPKSGGLAGKNQPAKIKRNVTAMRKNIEDKNIQQLLAEADELIEQINADALNDLEEEHRLEFEKYTQHLKKIKSEVQARTEQKEPSEIGSGAEGMHEAIQDIVKAMQNLKRYIL
jgi:phage-related protein